jgi:tRNA-dihydrouridine synthase
MNYINNTNKIKFLNYPAYVCAPMVEQSELPFRMLTRKYGVNIAYTPMLHSKMMITNKTYKQ